MVTAVEREGKEARKRAALTAEERNTEKLHILHWLVLFGKLQNFKHVGLNGGSGLLGGGP